MALRDEHGADAIAVGCTRMARDRDELEMAVLRAVIEPTVAARAMAFSQMQLVWGTAVHHLASSQSSLGPSSVSTR